MSKKRRREPTDATAPDLSPLPAEAPPARGPASPAAVDRHEVRAALAFLLVPFLSQLAQRGDLGTRIVDLMILLPSLCVIYAIHRLLYPGRIVYWGLLFLLALADAGAFALSFIGLFAVCAGMLFVALPALAAGPMYLRGRRDRLVALRDYLLSGLRITGVASALFCAAVAPHLFGALAIAPPPGAFVGLTATTAGATAVAVRESTVPKEAATLAALLAHVHGQSNRPWFARHLGAPSGDGFAVSFRTALPFFHRTYTYLVEAEGGTVRIRFATCHGDLPGHLLPLSPPAAPPAPAPETKSRFALDSLPVSGEYDPAELVLLSREMAEDAGLSGERVFVAAALDGCMIQISTQPADPAIPFSLYAERFEDAVIRRGWPDFATARNERFPLFSRDAFVIEGEAEIGGARWRLWFAVADVNGRLLTLQATARIGSADAFDAIFRAFVVALRHAGPEAAQE